MFRFFHLGELSPCKHVGELESIQFFLSLVRFIHTCCYTDYFHEKLNTQRHEITDWKYYIILNNSKQNSNYFMTTHILHSSVLALIQ